MTDVQKQIAKEAEVKEAKKGRICEWCGKPIPEHRNLLAKYCSNRCNQVNLSRRAGERDRAKRAIAREARAEVVECDYPPCGKEFLRERTNKRFCGKECRIKEDTRMRKIKAKEREVSKSTSKLDPKYLTRGKITYTGYKQKGGNKDG